MNNYYVMGPEPVPHQWWRGLAPGLSLPKAPVAHAQDGISDWLQQAAVGDRTYLECQKQMEASYRALARRVKRRIALTWAGRGYVLEVTE